MPPPPVQPPGVTPPPPSTPAKTRVEPMSTMRIKIAEHMVASKRTSAHVTTVHKVDMTTVTKILSRHKADFQARYGIALTYLPFVARAAVEALRAYPLLNASIEGNNILYHNDINIGIAVALENGLIVPVIRNADRRAFCGLRAGSRWISPRARDPGSSSRMKCRVEPRSRISAVLAASSRRRSSTNPRSRSWGSDAVEKNTQVVVVTQLRSARWLYLALTLRSPVN